MIQKALYLQPKTKLSIKKKKKKVILIREKPTEEIDETSAAVQSLIDQGNTVPFSIEFIPEFHEMT